MAGGVAAAALAFGGLIIDGIFAGSLKAVSRFLKPYALPKLLY